MSQLIGLFNLALVLLLPTVPAYLLFKALPSEAIVKGPLKGLHINLGGAFAGYFALLVLVLSTHTIWNPPLAYQVWDIYGELRDPKGVNIPTLGITDFDVQPAAFHNLGGGKFKLSVFTTVGQDGGIQFPSLEITRRPYADMPISLDDRTIKRNTDKHEITLSPITLAEQPSYGTGNKTTLTQVPALQEPAPQEPRPQ